MIQAHRVAAVVVAVVALIEVKVKLADQMDLALKGHCQESRLFMKRKILSPLIR